MRMGGRYASPDGIAIDIDGISGRTMSRMSRVRSSAVRPTPLLAGQVQRTQRIHADQSKKCPNSHSTAT